MKKLRLELEQLSVESFHVDPTVAAVGTVQANVWTDICSVLLGGSCDYSCNETCAATCRTCATNCGTCPISCANTQCAGTYCANQMAGTTIVES